MKRLAKRVLYGWFAYVISKDVVAATVRLVEQQRLLRGKRRLSAEEALRLAESGFGSLHPIPLRGPLGYIKWNRFELLAYKQVVSDAFEQAVMARDGQNIHLLLSAVRRMPLSYSDKWNVCLHMADDIKDTHLHIKWGLHSYLEAEGDKEELNCVDEGLLSEVLTQEDLSTQGEEFWEVVTRTMSHAFQDRQSSQVRELAGRYPDEIKAAVDRLENKMSQAEHDVLTYRIIAASTR